MADGAAPPLSVSTVAFDGYPLPVALGEIAKCGVSYAELAFIEGYGDFDESVFTTASAGKARAELARTGLSSVAVSAHMDLGTDDALERLRRRIAFAREIGATILITNAGLCAAREAILRTIEAVLPFSLDAGVVLALENPGHGTGAIFACAHDGIKLARTFASPALGLNYDAGNIFTYSLGALNPEADLPAALPHVVHAHLKDVRAMGDDWVFTPLGEGEVYSDTLARSLRRAERPIGIELPLRLRRPGRGHPVRAQTPVPLAAIVQAVKTSVARLDDERSRSARPGSATSTSPDGRLRPPLS